MNDTTRPAWLTELYEWLKALVVVFVAVFIITNFVIVNANIPTGSMHNTIMTNDRIIAYRLSYLFSQPKRSDIVVFKYPDDEKQLYVKRVIGLPGEKVEILKGDVYIDDVLCEEVNAHVPELPSGSFGPYYVPEDSYFMMGDNRNLSLDSRYWTNTYVQSDKILGKVIFRYWPKFTFLK